MLDIHVFVVHGLHSSPFCHLKIILMAPQS